MATVTLRLTPQRAHVRTARLVAAAMARRSGVAEELLDEVRLAVGEACGRAVQLHERNGIKDPVVLTLIDDNRFDVIVQDLAPAPGPAAGAASAAAGAANAGSAAAGAAAGGAGQVVPADASTGNHRADRDRPTGSVRAWEEPLDTGLGLALLDALVEDITVDATGARPGTQVRMSWPIDRPAADGGPGRLANSPAG